MDISVGIISAACHVPPHRRSVSELFHEERVQATPQTLTRLGIDQVPLCNGEGGSFMALAVSQEALQRAGIDAAQLDVIVDYTILPRMMNTLGDFTTTRDEEHFHGETRNPCFSTHEDPDYSKFFWAAVEVIEAYEQRRISAPEASKKIFEMADSYEFPVVIRRDAMIRAGWLKEGDQVSARDVEFTRKGFRWALTNPHTRDLFGSSETFFRWCARRPDPHLV